MAAFSFIPLPLHLNKPLYYMLFFYGGGLFWQNSQKIHEKASISGTVIMWILFLVCFVVFNLAMEFFSEIRESTDSRMIRVALYSANNLLKATLGWIGITACYLSAVRYCMEHNLSETIIKIGACGYGVYVFHQFILVFLYRYTSLPQMTGSYLMPWVGFIITVVLSTTMAILIRMTSFGRKYL